MRTLFKKALPEILTIQYYFTQLQKQRQKIVLQLNKPGNLIFV